MSEISSLSARHRVGAHLAPLTTLDGCDDARPEGTYLVAVDLIGFGRPLVANPDLPTLIRHTQAWAEHGPAKMFGGGAHGLADYPPFGT